MDFNKKEKSQIKMIKNDWNETEIILQAKLHL